jgi:hypothetical protein
VSYHVNQLHAIPATVDIAVHDNEVPAFIGTELDRLYGALYSSLACLRIGGSLTGVSTYIARRNGVPAAIFLFRREGEKIQVVNEGMRLDAHEVDRFARHMFATFDFVKVIAFHAVQTNARYIPLLHQSAFCAEDYIAALPATPQAYFASLGSATRKNIKRHQHRLEREFPSFNHCLFERGDADERYIRQLIEFNRLRLARKNISLDIDEDETRQIIRLVQQTGAVLAASIDGRLCGGSILYMIEKNWISRLNAHDPAFDAYRLGTLCCYLAVCKAIESGAEHFHFGNTWFDYKTALLGELQTFDHIALYRSPGALMRHAGMALKTACGGYALTTNRWVFHHVGTSNTLPWRVAGRMLAAWRAAKFRYVQDRQIH